MKLIAVLLSAVFMLLFVSCSDSQSGNLQDALSAITNNEPQVSSQAQDSQPAPSESNVEDNGNETIPAQGVSYTAYSALLKAYELDYNIENLSGTDYTITGMTITPTYPNQPEGMVDASGFCYANLVDLDNNGILELVMIAYDDQSILYDENWTYGDKVEFESLAYPNIIKIYTIMPEAGLVFLGSLPVESHQLPVSTNYGIEYIVSEDKTYITHSEVYQMGNGDIRYYGLTDGYFGVEAHFESDLEGNYTINGEEYSYEDFEATKAGYGESLVHPIENLNDEYLQQLKDINDATYSFLENYPVENFSEYSGAYNNGQFYYMEYSSEDYFPPNYTIESYYKALTMRDYDTLAVVLNDAEQIEWIKTWHTSDIHTYVPGYIISDLRQINIDEVRLPDMGSDINAFLNGLGAEHTIIMYATVNEILDPHTAQLGLQVAGGIYETYYILSSDDPESGQWIIEEKFDNKFYW